MKTLKQKYPEKMDLRDAYLREANLREANLREADLEGADLDFAVTNLSCKDFDQKVDEQLFYQRLYHLCRLNVKTKDESLKKVQQIIAEFANKWDGIKKHRLVRIEKEVS